MVLVVLLVLVLVLLLLLLLFESCSGEGVVSSNLGISKGNPSKGDLSKDGLSEDGLSKDCPSFSSFGGLGGVLFDENLNCRR